MCTSSDRTRSSRSEPSIRVCERGDVPFGLAVVEGFADDMKRPVEDDAERIRKEATAMADRKPVDLRSSYQSSRIDATGASRTPMFHCG